MKSTYFGIDLFRILCCLGVVIWHCISTLIVTQSVYVRIIWYVCGYSVTGFFLLGGFLFENHSIKNAGVDIEYCEKKVSRLLKQWVELLAFLLVIEYLFFGVMKSPVDIFLDGIEGKGMMGVTWFLFTYCIVLIMGYFFDVFMHMFPKLSVLMVCLGWFCMFFCGMEKITIDYTVAQTRWIHIFGLYFFSGMILRSLSEWGGIRRGKGNYFGLCLAFAICCTLYFYNALTFNDLDAPLKFYVKWYFVGYVFYMFMFLEKLDISDGRLRKMVRICAKRTFVVYFLHYPIILFINSLVAISNLRMALLESVVVFLICIFFSAIMEKMPLARKWI